MLALRSRRRAALLALSLFALACAAPRDAQRSDAPLAIDAAAIARDVAWLADPAREGRGLGSAGLAASAQYLAAEFARAGLAPAGDDGAFLQRFEAPTSLAIERAALTLGRDRLERGADFEALLASESGALPAELVFVGFGISSAEQGRDDYAGVDVRGKCVLVLGGAPSALARRERAAFGRRAYKLAAARRHGARAVLLAPRAGAERLAQAGSDPDAANPTQPSAGVVALDLARGPAERALRAGGLDLARAEARLAAGESVSQSLAVSISGEVRIARATGQVANVVGVLRGRDPRLVREAIVIGAHYDHLGSGEFGSLAPERRGELHPGADDNASGTAAIVAVARALAASGPARRTIVFAAFAGEEAGLLGSAHYVAHPPLPIADTVAMLNLDMVGRLAEDEVVAFGTGTARGLRRVALDAARAAGLRLSLESDGYGPSDHASFVAARVPALHFFTGTHEAYHSPDDIAASVNSAGTARVAELTARVALALANAPRRLEFTGEPPKPHGGAAPGGGYGPYLGTVPAFGGPPVRGVRISGVRTGSPAERAGLRGGDVLVGFGGDEIASLEEFSALLVTREPGEEVEVVVLRAGRRVALRAVLGMRN